MSLIKYRAFIRVAELGSITKVSKEFQYSQPGISRMLDSLEEEIGFPLLIRGKDFIKVTEDGKKLLYYCNQIVKNEDHLRETAASIKGLMSGTIRIGALNSLMVNFIPKIIRQFYSVYSNIKIYLQESNTPELQNELQSGRIDIEFTEEPPPKGFEFTPLFDDPIYLIMSESHPFASYKEIPASVLSGCDFIMPIGWEGIVDRICGKGASHPNSTHFVASDAAAIAMVADNLGVYPLSGLQLHRLPDNVIAKKFQGNPHRTIGIGVKSLKYATPATKEFIKYTQKYAEKFR